MPHRSNAIVRSTSTASIHRTSATGSTKTRTTTLVAAALLALTPIAAFAGTSGSVALTSDYLFRGVSQTNQEPALQAGLEFASDNGFYVGTWGSNVSWLSDVSTPAAPISSSLELDVYGGYRGKFSDKVGFDVGALYYWYPGDFPSGFNSADTGEIYVGLTAGPFAHTTVSAKYSYAVTDLFGYPESDGSGYLDLGASWEFVPTWTLIAHAGKQWVENNAIAEYADWKLGVSKAFDGGFSAALAYSDTDADEGLYTNPYGNFIADDAVTLTLTKTF